MHLNKSRRALVLVLTVFLPTFGFAIDRSSFAADKGQTQKSVRDALTGNGGVDLKKPSVIFTDQGTAKKIVFVCDASGSMTGKFQLVKNELNRALNQLNKTQAFDLIFFQGGNATMFSRDNQKKKGLIPADNRTTMLRASGFLEEIAVGNTGETTTAIAAALELKPDLVYFLTDGDLVDEAATLKKIQELNPPVKGKTPTKINTIAFVGEKDKDTKFLKTLESIAKDSGGTYHRVDAEKLQP
jgi:hypothetical protein